MKRRYEYRAASAARKPVVLVFESTGEVEFPGDIPADSWLALFDSYGEALSGDIIPMRMVEPVYRAVIGDRFDELRKEVSWREMQWAAQTLFRVYAGLEEVDDEEGDANPQSPSSA